MWVSSQSLRQLTRTYPTHSRKHSKNDHDGKPPADAKLDDEGSNCHSYSSHCCHKTSAQYPHLRGVQFIEIHIEISVLKGNGKSEDEDKCKDSYTVANVDLLLHLPLFPNEDHGERADESEEEASVGGCFSFDSGDHPVGEGEGQEGGDADDEAVDEEVEVELVQHQGWGVELEYDRALDYY